MVSNMSVGDANLSKKSKNVPQLTDDMQHKFGLTIELSLIELRLNKLETVRRLRKV